MSLESIIRSSSTLEDVPNNRPKNTSVSLLKSMIEVIEFILISFYYGKAADPQESVHTNRLKLYIRIEPELQKTTTDLTLFSITGGRADHLWNFGYAMQQLAKGSHLTIYAPDINDPEEILARDVIFTSCRRESTSYFHMTDESRIKKDNAEIPLIHLKAFMSLSSAMNEGKNLVDYLCALKLMNPNALLSFWMDCISLSHLDLCEDTGMKCGTHTLYAEPQKCFIRNLKDDCIYGAPIIQHSESREILSFESKQGIFESLITCILCIIPMHEHNNATDVVSKEENDTMRTHDFVQGQAFIQVYDKNGLPVDMINFQKCVKLQPDCLVSWNKYGIQVKKATLKCHPYNVQWLVRIVPETILPQEFNTCSQFLLHFCFVMNEMEGYQLFSMDDVSVRENDIKPFRDCADSCMKAFFVSHEEKVPIKPLIETVNGFEYWIPDIAKSLEGIFIRSTNAAFRATFGKYLHPNACRKDTLETLLWHAIKPSRKSISEDPHAEHQLNCDAKKVSELRLSPRAPISSRTHEVFTPDSLEIDDHEWDTTNMRMNGIEENMNDIECPLDLHGNLSVASSLKACQFQYRQKNPLDNKIDRPTFENEISFKPPHEKYSLNIIQHKNQLESPCEVYESSIEYANFLNCHTSYNVTDGPWILEDCVSEDSLEMNIEKVSTVNETRCIDDPEVKVENTEGRLIKKRSFEESEASTLFDKCEIEIDDWLSLEDDLDQMKRLKLCDFEVQGDSHILSRESKLYEEKVAVCEIIHEDLNDNTVPCKEQHRLLLESRNAESSRIKNCMLHHDEQTTYKTAEVNEAEIYSALHITASQIDHDVNIPNILHQKENFLAKQEEGEVETEKRAETRNAATEETQECVREQQDFSSMAKSVLDADVTEDEEEDWFDNKKLMDWYKSLYN